MASDKTEIEKAAKVEPKAPKVEAHEYEAAACLQARDLGDPVEVAIAEGVVERSLCGHTESRIVDLDEYAVSLARAVKAAIAEYRGEKE